MLTLNNLRSPKGAHKNIKRIGRGQGSGQGTQAGKGHKGQKARNGGGVRTGFEGNNLPLYMRLPKRGFKNSVFKDVFAIVNLETLEERFESGMISKEMIVEAGLVKGINKRLPVKILAKGELTKKFNFSGIEKFSKRAEEAIVKSGGSLN